MTSSRPLVSWLVASATSLAAFVAGCGSEATGAGSPDSVTPGATEESLLRCPVGETAQCSTCGPEDGCKKPVRTCSCEECGQLNEGPCPGVRSWSCMQGHVNSATGLCEACGGNGQRCCGDGLGNEKFPDCYDGTVCSYGRTCVAPTACITAAPDAVWTWQTDVVAYPSSSGVSYASTPCGAFVVESTGTPPTAPAGDYIDVMAGASSAERLTEAECAAVYDSIEVWEMGPTPRLIGSNTSHGQWNVQKGLPPNCALTGALSEYSATQPRQYRWIARSYMLGSDGVTKTPRPVTVGVAAYVYPKN